MGLSTIIRAFGIALVILALAMIVPLLAALSTRDDAVGDFFFACAITLFFGAGCLVMSAGRRATTDIRGALLLVLLWWGVAPVFGAMPFIVGGEPFIEAYFESVSALTTTGAWLLESEARSSIPGTLWRAIMQWLGGLGSLAIAAAIFIRPAFVGIDTLLPPFSRGDRDSYLHAINNAVVAFFGVYVLITVACWGALILADSAVFDATITAMSVVSSGGFVPGYHGEGVYAPHAPGVLLPFLFLSGANFVLIAGVFRSRQRNLRDVETATYATLIVVVAFLLWVLSGAGDLDRLPAQLFNSVSLMSTNGYIIGERPTLTVALVAVIIGGSAVSTAGGMKVLRWIIVMRRAGEEVRRLINPSAVFGRSSVTNELGVWIHFLMFTLILGALMVCITAGGYSFELAAAGAVGVLSNAGPVIHLTQEGADGYQIFENPLLKLVLIAGMVLGRLEGVAALALINRSFWRS